MEIVLKTYSFTDEDINLITYSLRQLKDSTGLATLATDAKDLLEHIERLKLENK